MHRKLNQFHKIVGGSTYAIAQLHGVVFTRTTTSAVLAIGLCVCVCVCVFVCVTRRYCIETAAPIKMDVSGICRLF